MVNRNQRTIDLNRLTIDDVMFAIRVINKWIEVNRRVQSLQRRMMPRQQYYGFNPFNPYSIMQNLFNIRQQGELSDEDVKKVVRRVKRKIKEDSKE